VVLQQTCGRARVLNTCSSHHYSALLQHPPTTFDAFQWILITFRLVEGEDDAFEFVTTQEVIIDTPIGPVTRLETVPLRPLTGSHAGQSSQPQLASPGKPQPVSGSNVDDFDVAMSHDDAPKVNQSKNKVIDIVLCKLLLIKSTSNIFGCRNLSTVQSICLQDCLHGRLCQMMEFVCNVQMANKRSGGAKIVPFRRFSVVPACAILILTTHCTR
jgi:hypothetical protein